MRPSRRPCTSVRSIIGARVSSQRSFTDSASRLMAALTSSIRRRMVAAFAASSVATACRRPAQIRTTKTSLTLRSAAVSVCRTSP